MDTEALPESLAGAMMAPIANTRIRDLVLAAYRLGWEERGAVEDAVRRGELEPLAERAA